MTARPIDDIDYELEATHFVIRTMITRTDELERERDVAIRRLNRESRGYIQKHSYCLCRWKKGIKKPEMVVNERCPQHGEKSIDFPEIRE